MSEPQTNTAPANTQAPLAAHKDWASAWQEGQKLAAAKEGGSTDTTADADGDAGGEGADAEMASGDSADDSADDGEPPGTDAASDADAGGEEDDDKAEAKGDEKKPEGSEDVRTLHALAKRLGFVVDGGIVTVEERRGFRAEKRKFHEQQTREVKDFQSKVTNVWQQLKPLADAKQLGESGDFDGALKALFGKDLSEINKLAADKLRNRDPRVDQIERENRELKERVAAREAAEQQERERAVEEAERQRYLSSISEEFSQSENPVHKKLAKDPSFLSLVHAKQKEHWDGHDTLTPEEAALLVEKDLRADYEILHSVFGGRTASQSESSSESTSVGRGNGTPAKQDGNGKKPSKTLPKRRAAEASPPGTRMLTEQEWVQQNARRMRQSSED